MRHHILAVVVTAPRLTMVACLLATWPMGNVATAAVNMQTVSVGDAGNAPDTRYSGIAVGGVAYTYSIGKYEVTAGQYCAFLNSVAATDSYGLYNDNMWSSGRGCKILREGSSGSYTYSVADDQANRPVNFVSWGDAARFANWMHNGQPTSAQGLTTTEDGSYFLNGRTGLDDLWQFLGVVREPDATWVIPTESEWYKAAYHENNGTTGDYWDYPTGTNTMPANDAIDPDLGNSANFRVQSDDYSIGSPYWRTPVGAFSNSPGPYGTFDQGGNVWEWNEAVVYGSYRGLRGGSWDGDGTGYYLHAGCRIIDPSPTDGVDDIGFRVAYVPEPATLALLTLGGPVLIRRRKRDRAAT